MVAGLAAVTVTAVRASDRAAGQRDIAVAEQLIGQSQLRSASDATSAREDAIAAWAIDPTALARLNLLAQAANRQVATFAAGTNSISSVAWSPDGKTLATTDLTPTVRLWNVAAQQVTGRIKDSLAVTSATFSPRDGIIATDDQDLSAKDSGARDVALWSAATGKRLGAIRPGPYSVIAGHQFSPDGATLAIGTGGGVQLWSVAPLRQAGALMFPAGSATSADVVEPVAWSGDGARLMTEEGTTVHIWDVARKRPVLGPVQDSDLGAFLGALSQDGRFLAIQASDSSVRLWDVDARRQAARITAADGGTISTMAFSPDGRTLAIGDSGNAVQLWDVASRSWAAAPFQDSAYSMAFSPDGKFLAIGGVDGIVRIWDVTASPVIARPQPGEGKPKFTVAFGPGGSGLLTLDDAGNLELPGGGTPDTVYKVDAGQVLDPGQAAYSPDGRLLAIGGFGGKVTLWNVATHQVAGRLQQPSSALDALEVAFSPDGRTLAVGGLQSGVLTLWDVATHRPLRTLDASATSGIIAVVFSRDGRTVAAASLGQVIRLWNTATGREITSFPAGDVGTVLGLAFSPDGRTLAGAGKDTALWDLATGQLITSRPSTPRADAVAFSRDGGTVLVATADATVIRWDVSYLRSPLGRVCAQVGGSLTQTDWGRQVPSGPAYRDPCPGS